MSTRSAFGAVNQHVGAVHSLSVKPRLNERKGDTSGDYASAIEDFKFYIEPMPEYEVFKHLRSKWQAWVAELEAARNPFDSAMLEVIRLSGEVFQ